MSRSSRPIAELAQEAHNSILMATEAFEKIYGMRVVESKAENSSACVCLRNEASFIRSTWYPTDGVRYDIGPLVDGSVPPVDIFYRPGKSPNTYEIAWFAKLSGGRVRSDIRGKSGGLAESLRNGVELAMVCAGQFLSGDWASRSELDRLIDQNYRDRNDR
jgi:hypothetical protein